MDLVWIPPEVPFVKINVHCTSRLEPHQNGNSNGVGVLIRDHEGKMLWGALGPMPGLSNVQALLWGVHAGMVEALNLGFEKTQIETDNREVHDVIRLQEYAFIEPDLEEVLLQINSLHRNFFIPDATVRDISLVPIRMNRSAEYLAEYSLSNLNAFESFSGSFGSLQYHLDRDMGLGRPFNDRIMQGNFGRGDIVDSP